MLTPTVGWHDRYRYAQLIASLSQGLRARIQGKTCFNFKAVDDELFRELAHVTAESLRDMRRAGYIAYGPVS